MEKKEKRKDIPILMQSSKELASRDKNVFFSDEYKKKKKKEEESNKMV